MRRFVLLHASNVLTVLLVAEVVVALAVPSLMWVARQDIDGLELFWKNRRETVYEVRALEFDLLALRDVDDELAGWRSSRLPWGEVITRIQRLYPANVGIARLTMRGQIDLQFERGAGEPHPSTVAYRSFYLQLEGVAQGAGVAGQVAEFTSSLEKDQRLNELFNPLKLQGILKKTDRTEFSLKTTSKSRSMQ